MKKNQIITVALIVAIASVFSLRSHAQVAKQGNDHLSSLTLSGTCSGLNYNARATFPTGSAPTAVARGDFNGDGKPDVAVANISSNDISILLGDGAGGFSPAVNFNVDTEPLAIAVGDFNGDGKQDLVTANYGGNDVSILLGDGAGGFSAAVNFSAGASPRAVAIADFNGDGKQDIAAANNGAQTFSVLLGDGAGNFGLTTYGLGGYGGGVAAGDFNADGKLDLAISVTDTNNVSILLGNGTGVFGTPTNYAVGLDPNFVAIGDFNNDGKSDLAVANVNSGTISVLLGNGSGTFSAAATFATGWNPGSISVGDLNGDNKTDLAVANGFSDNVSILLGNGAGGFSPASNFGTGPGSNGVTAADFNGDGKIDLVATNDSENNVALLLGDGAGSFGLRLGYEVGQNPRALATADFNGDGKQDLVAANFSSGNLSVLLSNGADFGAATNFSAATPFAVATGDFNGDGKQDLVSAGYSSNSVQIHLGDGAGSFAFFDAFGVGGRAVAVAVGDVNGDGKQDLAVVAQTTNTVVVLLGDGTGEFSQSSYSAVGSFPNSVAISDLNGDGKPDLAVSNSSAGNVSVLLGDGAGGFGAAANFSVGPAPQSVTVGDFNGDGKKDLVTANRLSDSVSVLLGNGAGSFGAAANFSVGTRPTSLVVGDLDGDGKQDIAVANSDSNNVSILLGDGAGAFATAITADVGSFPNAIVMGDFDGGGVPDLATVDSGGNGVWTLLRTCPAVTTSLVVTNTNDSGPGSLRQAMLDANSAPGMQTISFNIPGAGVHTISPLSALPQVSDPVVIDGSTQPGYSSAPVIEVSGTQAGASTNGFDVIAGGTTVRGLTINRFANAGIIFTTAGGNLVEGCYLGTDASGDVARGNRYGLASDGVSLEMRKSLVSGNGASTDSAGGGIWISPGVRNFAAQSSMQSVSPDFASGAIWIHTVFVGTNHNGSAAVANGFGVLVENTSNVLIGGDSPADRNIISGNNGHGIEISGATSVGEVIKNNYIGTNDSGTAAVGNHGHGVYLHNLAGSSTQTAVEINNSLISGNGGDGINDPQGRFIWIHARCVVGTNADGNAAIPNQGNGISIIDTSNVLVGGDTAADGNIISGNLKNGIEISGATSVGNLIKNNYIGTNSSGTTAVGNHGHGVYLHNLNGSATETAVEINSNLISGNGRDGVNDPLGGTIWIHSGKIGTNAAGNGAIPNGGNGISIVDTANVLVGGDTAADRNLISGNNGHGIEISGATSVGEVIKNNYIGTNAAGTAAIGNVHNGIYLHNLSGNPNVHAAEIASNLISGNGGDGISDPQSWFVWIHSNLIGANAAGHAVIPNHGNGISIHDTSNVLVGGDAAADGNLITGNGGAGIAIFGASTNITIRNNSIFGNGGLGIDFGGDGPTANDPCDADHGKQNYPVLAQVRSASSTTITGALNSKPNATFRIDFFWSDTAGPGIGQNYFGSAMVTTNGSCNGAIDITIPAAVAPGKFVTTTATDAAGNTSEFSAAVIVLQSNQGPRRILQDVMAQLIALRNSLANTYDRGELADAIHELNDSLDPQLWIDDSHLRPNRGDFAFHEDKDGIRELRELVRSRRSTIPDPILLGLIARIVQADRLLAEVAISDAVARHGDARLIAAANAAIADGDNDAMAGKPNQAIEDYREAWALAMRA